MQSLAKDVVDVLGVRFHRVTKMEAVEKILHWCQDNSHHMVVTAGPEFVMQCSANDALLRVVNSADLVTADGIGIVWAAARNGKPVPERVTGVELLPEVFAEADERRQPLRVYLLGASQVSLDICLQKLRSRYTSLTFEGRNGYFSQADVDAILAEVSAFEPDLLLVGMGQPRQELFLRDILGRINACVGIGIGGSIDAWGGTVRRAPAVFQRLNVEWLYRLVSQPKRWRRQMALPRFAMKILARKDAHS